MTTITTTSTTSALAANKKKYITLKKNEGCDFRSLAKIMTAKGYRMNHATARNQLMLALEFLLNFMCQKLQTNMTQKDIKKMIEENQDIHDNLPDILYAAHKQLSNSSSNNNEEEKEEDNSSSSSNNKIKRNKKASTNDIIIKYRK